VGKHLLNKEPLVSIVTPSYNQGAFLEQTILSVLEQTYPTVEYFVMDGGSDDKSVDVIKKYADQIKFWESIQDRGQAHAINKGLQRAKGEILGWLNSDDVFLPGTVERIVNTFNQHPEIDVVYGRLERINANGDLIPTPTLPKDQVTFYRGLVIGECVVNQPGSFWRRRIMNQVGLLNEGLKYALDYEYWIRMAISGAEFFRLPEVVAKFRLSEESKTVGGTAAMAEEQLDVLENLLERPDLPQILSLDPNRINQLAREARGRIGLHAFFGSLKQKNWYKVQYWFRYVLGNAPEVFLDRRWIDLGWASLKRRMITKSR
jgi:glycosyltransferase involved in cell wall biosynthesis